MWHVREGVGYEEPLINHQNGGPSIERSRDLASKDDDGNEDGGCTRICARNDTKQHERPEAMHAQDHTAAAHWTDGPEKPKPAARKHASRCFFAHR